MRLAKKLRPESDPAVSIPFSSGQRMRRRVSSQFRLVGFRVSIPFSSGQRMRPTAHSRIAIPPFFCFNPLFIGSKDATELGHRRAMLRSCCFNPLFIGSKDATNVDLSKRGGDDDGFQSPFHRVKGCDSRRRAIALARLRAVSIPFSSGQRMRRNCQVRPSVETKIVSIPFSSGQRMRRGRASINIAYDIPVSIPFSSGQRMRRCAIAWYDVSL